MNGKTSNSNDRSFVIIAKSPYLFPVKRLSQQNTYRMVIRQLTDTTSFINFINVLLPNKILVTIQLLFKSDNKQIDVNQSRANIKQ